MRKYAVLLVLAGIVLVLMTAAAQPRIIRVPPRAGRVLPPGGLDALPGPEGVRVPLTLDDYCVYSLAVDGTGDIDASIEWDRADVALAMRLFAPGTQQVMAEADGYRRAEISAKAGIRMVEPDGPTGDWMLEIRQVAGPPIPAAGLLPTAAAAPESTRRPATALAQPERQVELQSPFARVRMTEDGTRRPGLWRPRITGSLSARWPGAAADGIVNVTARQELLRRRLAALGAEADSLREWQLQWDEAARAYALAGLARQDLEDLSRDLDGIVDMLDHGEGDAADLSEEARKAAEDAKEQFQEALRILREAAERQSENVSTITNPD